MAKGSLAVKLQAVDGNHTVLAVKGGTRRSVSGKLANFFFVGGLGKIRGIDLIHESVFLNC